MTVEGKTRRAERLLEADPDLKVSVVARVVGCSLATVKLARKGLGAHRATKMERCEAVLRKEPDLDLSIVAEAVGCSYGTAYAAAKRLGIGRDRRYASVIGTHRRWHVRQGTPNPECPLCRDEGSTRQGVA